MAHASPLDSSALTLIAEQVAELLPVGLAARGGELTLGETFEVWALTTPLADSDDISKVAISTNTYHLQLSLHDHAVGFVRSRPVGNAGRWEVTEVFQSPLGMRIEEAIVNIDEHVTDDVPTRLVLAPEYQLAVFWFVKPGIDRCYVVSCPSTRLTFKIGELIPGAEFLARLKREKPIRGLRYNRERSSGREERDTPK
jgi:hypothetical protein